MRFGAWRLHRRAGLDARFDKPRPGLAFLFGVNRWFAPPADCPFGTSSHYRESPINTNGAQ